MAGYVRFLFAIMLCIANMIIYGLKVNITMTVTQMAKPSTSKLNESYVECPQFIEINNSTVVKNTDDLYDWNDKQKGLIISLYFAGYMLGMFPAGYFADRLNTKWVLLISVFANSIFSLLVPLAAQHIGLLLALRFLTGLVSAANLPVVNVLVGKWVVYEEKSTWVAIINSGTSLGTVISILSSGLISNDINWQAVFYIHGALPLIWCVLFAIFFADNPETQKYISEPERELIVKSYGHRQLSNNNIKIPWREIFKSKPFWALVITNCFGNFIWYFLLTQLPLYMAYILKYNIKSNATISCLPYLINAFLNPLLGKVLDFGRRRGYWSQTNGRKLAVGISCIPSSIMLLIIAYIGCDRATTTILLIMSIVIGGAVFVGHLTNQNDIAPNYAGILMGITNTPGTISAFILPILVGVWNENGNHTFAGWRNVIWIVVVAQIFAFLVFTIFGTAKIQSWNYPGGRPPTEHTNGTDKTKAEDGVTSRML